MVLKGFEAGKAPIRHRLKRFDMTKTHTGHDFGYLTIEGQTVMFKIDAYDLDLQYY
jgi:hypothetical protein